MNVLITGSSGFLGQTLINTIKLKRPKWKIVGTDIRCLENQEFDFIKIDLLEEISWKNLLVENDVDLVFHLAGVFHNIDNFSMMKINTTQTLSMFESIRKLESEIKVILIGSAAQYGYVNSNDLPIREEHSQNPVSFYGLTKKWQEEIALFYSRKFGIKIICTRPSNFIGPRVAQTLLPGYLTKIFSSSEKSLDIEISSKKDARDYIDARDASSALLRLSEMEECNGEIFNISSSELISNEILVNLFADVTQLKVNIKELNSNVSKISLSNEKLRKHTDWKKEYSIKDSVKWCLS